MSVEEFIDYVIDEYVAVHPGENDDIGHFWKEAMGLFSEAMLKMPVSKKNASRILYALSKDVMHQRALDWRRAKKLRDIYECRVCAEAIAQMVERGAITCAREDIFGINDLMTDEELQTAVKKMI
ncbi:hypothetical protein [Butyrivibrio sp. JL13D10]|uniref:hypothetical protein n=1 Tax=Butyrivibrio sp. JL13D10 TaxID=3236815 RepID=UPI0038B673DF